MKQLRNAVDAVQASVPAIGESWADHTPLNSLRARPIHWFFAIPVSLAALLFPRRIGPHLAASSWVAVLVVAGFSAVYALGTMAAFNASMPGLNPFDPRQLTWLDTLRLPPAALATLALVFVSTWENVAQVWGIVCLVVALVFLAAALLAPLISAGERPRNAFFRSLKLLLLSTPALAVSSLVVGLVSWDVLPYVGHGAGILAAMCCIVWWLSILIRLGGRYGGRRIGPRWEPRPARCEDCGYLLTTLPITARCTECGLPVAESLPSRRVLPAVARTSNPLLWPGAFIHTLVAVLLVPNFARRVRTWDGHRAALNFAISVCFLCGLIGLASHLLLLDQSPIDALSIGLGIGLTCFAWLVLVNFILSAFAFRDGARYRVLTCYGHAGLVPLLALFFLGFSIGDWFAERFVFPTYRISNDLSVDVDSLIRLAWLLPAGVFLVFLLRYYLRGFRHTRFAAA